jgi:hypothetical protein
LSDNWIALIPEDPHFVPEREKQTLARLRLAEIAPDAEEVTVVLSETIQFFDCGTNFESALCPSCGREVPLDWWQERMDEDHEEGFKLDRYSMPCCDAAHTLRELTYNWPQAFGRFALDAMNPNIGILKDEHRRELEEILGTRLIVVYQHI